MSIFLQSDRDEHLELSFGTWAYTLEVAKRLGWKPSGTTQDVCLRCGGSSSICKCEGKPDPTKWDGGYFTNDCQAVTANDAHNLANALKKEKGWDEFIDFFKLGRFTIG